MKLELTVNIPIHGIETEVGGNMIFVRVFWKNGSKTEMFEEQYQVCDTTGMCGTHRDWEWYDAMRGPENDKFYKEVLDSEYLKAAFYDALEKFVRKEDADFIEETTDYFAEKDNQ